ncbi:hypothetical protein [Mangrovibacter phragmitis]|uniref:hypothetical protein n=1 Tax=Mangrovibacter phragmitis TaxID=1691903 RepID=UPI00336A5B0B
MKDVLVFFDNQPVKVVNVTAPEKTVLCECVSGEAVELDIMVAGIHSITGDHKKICIATDRELNPDEIVIAVDLLL